MPNQSSNESTLNTVWGDTAHLKKIKSAMVIKPDQHGNKVSHNEIRKIVTEERIAVDSLVESENGNVYVNFPDETSRDRVTAIVEESHAANPVEKLKAKLPTISLLGVTPREMKNEDGDEYSRTDLESDLYRKNKSVAQLIDGGATLKVVYIRRPSGRQEFYTVAIRVSPDIRTLVHKMNGIHMGLRHYNVDDRFHVRRCNRCQGLGHYEEHCREDYNCGYCAKNHKFEECPDKKSPHSQHKCINCTVADGKNVYGHPTFWSKCPTYKDQQAKMKKSVSFDYDSLKSN